MLDMYLATHQNITRQDGETLHFDEKDEAYLEGLSDAHAEFVKALKDDAGCMTKRDLKAVFEIRAKYFARLAERVSEAYWD